MRILIIKFRNIGDVLLSTPLLENLKINYPSAKIDYALNSNCSEMLSLNPNINNLFKYNRDKIKNKNLFLQIIEEIKYIKKIIKINYDIVINLTEGDRGSLISLLCKSKIKLGYKPRKGILKFIKIYTKKGIENQIIHSIEKDLQFVKLLNKNIINKKVSIYWSKNDKKEIDTILENNKISSFVHIHPVSRWMFKCWDDNKMAQVIDYIESIKKIKVIITSSPDKIEIDRVNNILTLCKTKPIDLSGKLSLKELSYLSSTSKMFFGVDSAPMHIAAISTKVVALFGASRIDFWGPWDNKEIICPYTNENTTQRMGKHISIVKTNHTIYFKNGKKKCNGMQDISIDEAKLCISEILK